jgi:hypothetical protein
MRKGVFAGTSHHSPYAVAFPRIEPSISVAGDFFSVGGFAAEAPVYYAHASGPLAGAFDTDVFGG